MGVDCQHYCSEAFEASVSRKYGAVGATTKFQRTTTPHRCKVSALVDEEINVEEHLLSCSRIAVCDRVVEGR